MNNLSTHAPRMPRAKSCCCGSMRKTLSHLPLATIQLFASVALASAPAKLTPAPHTSTPAQTTGSQAVKGGMPKINAAGFGKLDLSKLPVGPDGKRMVALVNGVPITEEHFVGELKKAVGPIYGTNAPKAEGITSALAHPVLDQLINTALMADFGSKHNIQVTEEDIDKAISAENSRRPAGHKLQDDAFQMGQSEAEMRRSVRDSMIQQRVQDYIGDQFTTRTPTESELHQFLLKSGTMTTRTVELRASHIVVRAKPDMTKEQIEDAKARADRTLELIRKGLDFTTAARQNSEDRKTVIKGGDLGYFTHGQMMPEFEKVAFSLKPGEVSDVVRTPVGFHIIKVTERYEDNSHGVWFASEKLRALDEFRRKLREQAKIERFL